MIFFPLHDINNADIRRPDWVTSELCRLIQYFRNLNDWVHYLIRKLKVEHRVSGSKLWADGNIFAPGVQSVLCGHLHGHEMFNCTKLQRTIYQRMSFWMKLWQDGVSPFDPNPIFYCVKHQHPLLRMKKRMIKTAGCLGEMFIRHWKCTVVSGQWPESNHRERYYPCREGSSSYSVLAHFWVIAQKH